MATNAMDPMGGLADRYGFIVVYPQTTSSHGCFDVHSAA
jgi:hypothetical protein